MQKTGDAKNQTKVAKEKELIKLAYNDIQIRKYTDTNPVLEIQGAIVKENAKEEWKIEFTDTKNRYNLSKDGEIKEAKPALIVAYKDGVLTEKTKYEAITVEYESLKVNNGILEMDINDSYTDSKIKFTSNIQKYQNTFDMVNGGSLINSNEFVPGFFVDSNWKIVKDFNNLSDDDYYLFIVQSEEDQNDLMIGNYVMEYDCGWITEWFDKPVLDPIDLIGKSGIRETEFYVDIHNSNSGYMERSDYTKDDFEEKLDSFKELIRTGEIALSNVSRYSDIFHVFTTNEEKYIDNKGNYYGSIIKGLALSSRPVIRMGERSQLNYGLIYDVTVPSGTMGFPLPAAIRLKSTKEDVSQSEFDDGFTYDNVWKHSPDFDEYEYYIEEKWYTFEKGHQITID